VHNADYNLNLFETIIEEFESFLLSNEVFWPLGSNPQKGQPPFPQLSMGQFQLTKKELEAVEDELDPNQSLRWAKIRERAWMLRSKWTTAMAQKALAEASQRLNLWRAYLVDIKEGSVTSGNFPYEVRHRVILDLLSEFTQLLDDDQIRAQLKSIDGILRGMLTGSSQFIWDEPLSRVYPEQDYWYLYRRPLNRTDEA
jgi:hypothetical protein